LAVSTPIVQTFDPGSFLLLPARRGQIGRRIVDAFLREAKSPEPYRHRSG
jgi:hypothetical protein